VPIRPLNQFKGPCFIQRQTHNSRGISQFTRTREHISVDPISKAQILQLVSLLPSSLLSQASQLIRNSSSANSFLSSSSSFISILVFFLVMFLMLGSGSGNGPTVIIKVRRHFKFGGIEVLKDQLPSRQADSQVLLVDPNS